MENKFKDDNGIFKLGKVASYYDRSIVVILTALGVIVATYISMGKRFDILVRGTPVIKELQEINAVQKEINRVVEKSMDKIDVKLDMIIYRMKSERRN